MANVSAFKTWSRYLLRGLQAVGVLAAVAMVALSVTPGVVEEPIGGVYLLGLAVVALLFVIVAEAFT